MEMTGLKVEREVILEVAAIVSDLNFAEIATYHSVLKQPTSYLDNMDEWNKTHHKQSGLLDLVPAGRRPEEVEDQLISLVDVHFPDEKIILAGNSIGQDRLFIDRYFQRFSARLHYRMVDVTSFKVIFTSLWGTQFKKKDGHRALDDIRESIAELRHYLSFVKM